MRDVVCSFRVRKPLGFVELDRMQYHLELSGYPLSWLLCDGRIILQQCYDQFISFIKIVMSSRPAFVGWYVGNSARRLSILRYHCKLRMKIRMPACFRLWANFATYSISRPESVKQGSESNELGRIGAWS
jgi:hypothetical protein